MRFSWQSNINMSGEKSDNWRFSSYFNELQKEEKAKYKCRPTLTNGQLLPDRMELLRIGRAMRNSCLMSLGVTCTITL